jgi:hypothetical protein
MTGIAAIANNISYNSGGYGRVFWFACEKNRFYAFIQRSVRVSDCLFILKIAYVANAPEDKLCIDLFAKNNCQSFVNGSFNPGLIFIDFLYPGQSLLS